MNPDGIGGFKKGQSGNPGGRPAELAEVKALAREQTEANINALVTIRDNPESPASARVAAANALLDRGWGRPTQGLEHSGPNGGPIPGADPPWKGMGYKTEADWLKACEIMDNFTARALEQCQTNEAYQVLKEVVETKGFPPPSGSELRSAIPCVHLQDWREEVFSRGVLSKDASDALEAFSRLKKDALERGWIAVSDGLVQALTGRDGRWLY